MMKRLLRNWMQLCLLMGFAIAALGLGGCATDGEPKFPDGGEAPMAQQPRPFNIFHRGDLVIISFTQVGGSERKDHEERVKDDGTITPPELGRPIVALGKSTGELQQELQKEYNRLYTAMTVTVKSELRYYVVEGEVKMPGQKTYLGETDVLTAVAAAGGFTEFANRRSMLLIRPNGDQQEVDYRRAVRDREHNLAIYPGDKLVVRRSWL